MLKRWGILVSLLMVLAGVQVSPVASAPQAEAAGCSTSADSRGDKYTASVTVGVSCSSGSSGSSAGGSSGSSGCHDRAGQTIACSMSGYVWTPALGLYCQVSAARMAPPTARYRNPDGSVSGRWYACLVNAAGVWKSMLMWLDVVPVARVDAGVVARRLVDSVGLVAPGVGVGAWVDPGFEVWGRSWWVGAPLWLWVDNQSDAAAWGWHSVSASQSGVTVTATVGPSVVVFSTGDGGLVSCVSAGSARVYDPMALMSAHSPCGCEYAYGQTNRLGDPGSRYTVSATVTWVVSYTASDGQHGGFSVQTHSVDNPSIHVGQLKSLRR